MTDRENFVYTSILFLACLWLAISMTLSALHLFTALAAFWGGSIYFLIFAYFWSKI